MKTAFKEGYEESLTKQMFHLDTSNPKFEGLPRTQIIYTSDRLLPGHTRE
jgi:hypothetical protein